MGILRDVARAFKPSSVAKGLDAARNPPSQAEIDAAVAQLPPEQRAAYEANMAEVRRGEEESQRSWEEATYATAVRDRDYFNAIYFREPRGVLFKIATLSPGFAVDEDPARLGEALRLPRQHEHLCDQLERTLTPLASPGAALAA